MCSLFIKIKIICENKKSLQNEAFKYWKFQDDWTQSRLWLSEVLLLNIINIWQNGRFIWRPNTEPNISDNGTCHITTNRNITRMPIIIKRSAQCCIPFKNRGSIKINWKLNRAVDCSTKWKWSKSITLFGNANIINSPIFDCTWYVESRLWTVCWATKWVIKTKRDQKQSLYRIKLPVLFLKSF